MDDQEIQKNLQTLSELMFHNGIALDCICEVEDRELYRFITEELFDQEIMDISVPGMMTRFIYEEFHPNHEYDVEQTVVDFITHVLLKKVDTDDRSFNQRVKFNLNSDIDIDKAIQNVRNFINSWSEITIDEFELTKLQLSEDEQSANVRFKIAYNATLEESNEVVTFEGEGRMHLTNVFQQLGVAGWDVLECDLPGFRL